VAPTIESIIEQTQTVYSLPLFYDRLNEAINHPRSSLADLGRVISEDQGLTARLLKLANSPLFGYHATIDSITKALTLVGTQQLRDLALAVSVMGSFSSIPNDLIVMKQFWKHNIACGILSRSIAIYRREVNQERFFVAGMLHDVGILVMCTAIPAAVMAMQEDRVNNNSLNHLQEMANLGFDHSAVGSALLTKWKIPLNISEPIAAHHAPESAGKYPVEAATVHVADIICNSMEIGLTAARLVPPMSNAAWKLLDIPVSQLDTIIKQSETQIEEIFAVLSEEP
jgi:HD-like signal output (HDOD) protein